MNVACSSFTFIAKGQIKCPHCETVSNEDIRVVVQATVTKEGSHYVSHCPELDIASCGDTVEEAFANLKDALLVYFTTLEETGQRERVFQEKGIKFGVELEPKNRLVYEDIIQAPVCA